jgi:hypothetical protein
VQLETKLTALVTGETMSGAIGKEVTSSLDKHVPKLVSRAVATLPHDVATAAKPASNYFH